MTNVQALRKTRLRDLDCLLDDLERLNLNDCADVPPCLVERLSGYGIVASGHTPTQLIECVWAAQEPWIIPVVVPRRRYRRRQAFMLAASGSMRLAGNAEMVSSRQMRQASYWRRWYRENRDVRRAREREAYRLHRQKHLARKRAFYRLHREAILARDRARRAERRATPPRPP